MNEIFDFLIETKPHINKIIFHKNYFNYKRYMRYFTNKLKELKEKKLLYFNSSTKIELDS